MKLTNKYGYTESEVQAVAAMLERPTKGVYRVTELIGPPLRRHLLYTQWDNITADVDDFFWALLGTSYHAMMSGQIGKVGAETETRWSTQIDGAMVTGCADLCEGDTIKDFKLSRVISLKYEKKEWVYQLNMYRALRFICDNKTTTRLSIQLRFRDWTMQEYTRDPENYPPSKAWEIELPVMPHPDIMDYIQGRLNIHKAVDGTVPCTEDERWTRGSVWVVKKPESTRAWRTYADKTEADKVCGEHPGMTCTYREGTSLACEHYCLARFVCPFRSQFVTGE